MTDADLERAYNFLNRHLFDAKLPHILVKFDNCNGHGGYFSPLGIIGIDPGRPLHETLGNLLHEMVHTWQHAFGHPSDEHDEEFDQKMRELGLIPPTDGGLHTLVRRGPFHRAYLRMTRDPT